MANYIPFNQNPASRDMKTAAYTIPSGKYAFVHPLAYDDDFTIGGDVVIPKLSVTYTQTLNASDTDVYSPPDGYTFKGHVSVNAYSATGWNSTSDRYQLAIYSDALNYIFLDVQYATSTTARVTNVLSGIGLTVTHPSDDIAGRVEVEIQSGDALEYDHMTSLTTNYIHVAGMLQQPMGVQHIFHVPSGVEVDGSKFEVTLFNEV